MSVRKTEAKETTSTETKVQAIERFAKQYRIWAQKCEVEIDSLENVRRWAGSTFGKIPSDDGCRKIAKSAKETA